MKFFKAVDKDNGARFVDLDKVEAVSCSVERKGGGLDILSIVDGGEQRNAPTKITNIVTLSMAGGDEEVRFEDAAQAEKWLNQTFGITVSFDQL